MKIAKNSVVTFRYEMIILEEDGTRTQQVEKSRPLTVLFGRGNLLEPFEKHLYGLQKDDDFDFTLKYQDTYGPYKPEGVQEFEKSEIIDGIDLKEEDLEPGITLPMETEDGTPFNGQILEISDQKIVLDFNHPLAGRDLIFRGNIQEVREATEEELQRGKNAASWGAACSRKS